MAGLGLEDVRLEDVVLMTVQEAGRTGRLAAHLPFIIPTFDPLLGKSNRQRRQRLPLILCLAVTIGKYAVRLLVNTISADGVI